MIWPLLLVLLCNMFYHIVTKTTPNNADTFLSLTVTYLVAAAVSFLIFIFTGKNLGEEVHNLNYTSAVLGVLIIGLEAGWIFAYRTELKVSSASLIANIALACVLVFVGALLFREKITVRQVIGIAVCIGGLTLLTI